MGRKNKTGISKERVDLLLAVNDGKIIRQGLDICLGIDCESAPILLRDEDITSIKEALKATKKYPELKSLDLGLEVVYYRLGLERMRKIYETYTNPAVVKMGIKYLELLERRGALLSEGSPYRKQIDALRKK